MTCWRVPARLALWTSLAALASASRLRATQRRLEADSLGTSPGGPTTTLSPPSWPEGGTSKTASKAAAAANGASGGAVGGAVSAAVAGVGTAGVAPAVYHAAMASQYAPHAYVFQEKRPEGENTTDGITQDVELFRFVTPYKTNLEVAVDLTPHSAMLRSATDKDGFISFYVFIDTWVDKNGRRDPQVYMDSDGTCSRVGHSPSSGTGWNVSVDLVFFDKTLDLRPKEELVLASGVFGGTYTIGQISTFEGNLVKDQDGDECGLLLDEEAPLMFTDGKPLVFASEGGKGDGAAKFDRGRKLAGVNNGGGNYVNDVVGGKLVDIDVTQASIQHRTATTRFDKNKLTPYIGQWVFYDPGDIDSSFDYRDPAGSVTGVDNDTLTVQVAKPCLPTAATEMRPRLKVLNLPNGSTFVKDAERDARQAREYEGSKAPPPQDRRAPFLLGREGHGAPLARMLPVQRVDTTSGQDAENDLEPGQRVVVYARQQAGHLFYRDFRLASLQPGDKTIMQLAITGHGWAATSQQCGEFCIMVFMLSMNGKSVANISEWRDDCGQNPNGEYQMGTWTISRNGWCPGSVEPGLEFDASDWVQPGVNHLEMKIRVWKNGRYEDFVNERGFESGDRSLVAVSMGMRVYEADQVKAIQEWHKRTGAHPETPTEAAILSPEGASHPQALLGPLETWQPDRDRFGSMVQLGQLWKEAPMQAPAQVAPGASLMQFEATEADVPGGSALLQVANEAAKGSALLGNPFNVSGREDAPPGSFLQQAADKEAWHSPRNHAHTFTIESSAPVTEGAGQTNGIDFESAYPFYNYDAARSGPLGERLGGRRVQVLTNAIVRMESRHVEVRVPAANLPVQWTKVAGHIVLDKPNDGDFDHWDREASVGIKARSEAKGATFIQQPTPMKKLWALTDGPCQKKHAAVVAAA